MPHVRGTVPNLLNGISQQAVTLRLPSQAEICDNYYPAIVDGLVPRPRTDHLANLGVNLPAGTFIHTILRDDDEKYILAITPAGAIRVWDFAGVEKTVTNSGASYLAGITDPETELRALTVADHTFIVNKKKVVAAGSATAPTRPHEAVIEVRAGNYARTYRINVNGAEAVAYRTPDGGQASDGPFIDTVQIASFLFTGLATGAAPSLPSGSFTSSGGGFNGGRQWTLWTGALDSGSLLNGAIYSTNIGAFAPGSNNFAIETRFECTALTGQVRALAGQANNDGNGTGFVSSNSSFAIYRNASNQIVAVVRVGGANIVLTGTAQYTNLLNTGSHHLALVRSGSTLRLMIDGVQQASAAISGSVETSTQAIGLGMYDFVNGGNPWTGRLDNWRFSVGTDRGWTTTFTAPTGVADDQYTVSMLTFTGTTFVDESISWQIGRYNSTVYLRNLKQDFTLAVEDGYGGTAMKSSKTAVQKFADLPQHGPNGVVMKIEGDDTTDFGEYWVKFEKTNDANGFGAWKECPSPGTVLGLNAATMPHTLRRNEDGTFTFGPATWDERTCGDVETVPDPSFVGHTIRDVFFMRNRLGFLTEENYVLTEHGEYFNFYRTTLTALLDTDMIDGAASHIKVSHLRHAVPYSELTLLFSDQTQFRLDGNDLLTPKTVNAKPLSELSANPNIRPVPAGTNLYFMSEGAEWASLYEYFIDKSIQSAEDDNVSEHAPSYIPAGCRRLIASPETNIVLATTHGDPDAIYVYKFHWNGQEKVQSAWARWSYPGVDEILDIEFDKKTVIATVRRGTTTCIERLNVEAGVKDPGSDYITYLDRHVLLDNGVYNAGTGKTTFTLPYAVPSTIKCVTAPGGVTVPGVELAPSSVTGLTVVFDGDLSADVIRFGTEFECRYRFSPFNYRGPDGKQPVQDGRLQVLTLGIHFAKSSYFRIEVTPANRPMRTYPWASNVVGSAVLGAINIASGRISIPVMSRNDRVTIDIVNDTWRPCSFIGAEWRGTFNPSSREK